MPPRKRGQKFCTVSAKNAGNGFQWGEYTGEVSGEGLLVVSEAGVVVVEGHGRLITE